jgi:hypothetical protein
MGLVLLAKLLDVKLVEYFQDLYATPNIGHCSQPEKHILWTLPMRPVVIYLSQVEKYYINIIEGNFKFL